MEIDRCIQALEKIATENSTVSEEIGFALGLLRHCREHGFSRKDRVTSLPDTTEAFSYFTVVECNEAGEAIGSIKDEKGNPVEFLPSSKVVEQL